MTPKDALDLLVSALQRAGSFNKLEGAGINAAIKSLEDAIATPEKAENVIPFPTPPQST